MRFPIRFAFLFCAIPLLLLSGEIARAQAPLFLVDEQTQVRSVSFRFLDTRTFPASTLQEQIATTPPRFLDRGIIGSVRSRLPVFGTPAPYPFDPVEVQRDILRLQRYYQRNGFPRAAVDYLARLDSSDNRISILFTVEEGPELTITSVQFVGETEGRLLPSLPRELQADWRRFRRAVEVREGRRLDDFALTSLQSQTTGWLQERGYPFADVGAERFVDSTGLTASVQLKVVPGPRAVYGDIEVQGAESVRDRVVLRELPFGPGDRFRASGLAEGRREVFGLNLFQLALVDVAPEQAQDSTADILVRVREGPRRVVNAYTGYVDRGGLTGRLQFTHRNFLGDARSFTASVEARSGFLGTVRVGGAPITDYSAALSLRQPYVFHRQLSAGASLLGRSRNDEIERSDQVEGGASMLFERAPLQTAALAASINYRVLRFDEGRSFGLLDPDILGEDALRATTAALDLSATYGVVDAPLQPRQGFIFRPGVRLATPPFTDVPHLRARSVLTGFLPFGRTGSLVGRASGGFLVPFGGTDPDNLRDYLLLRDQYFFAGGTQDVRGWGETRLGPKLFDLLFIEGDPETAEDDRIETLGYFGLGGRGRVSGSIQANIPVRDRLGASIFVDGGQVLRPAQAYTNALFLEPEFDFFRGVLDAENGFRVGTGVGLQYLTPVGFVNIAVGFKVNPSFLDVRPATVLSDIFRRQLVGEPVSLDDYADDARFIRRFQLHFSIGQTF